MKRLILVVCLVVLGFSSSDLQAQSSFRVEVTNETGSDFFTTPVWFGLHNGGFDLFNVGEQASDELEIVAEVGRLTELQTAFAASPASPGDIQGAVAFQGPGGPRPIGPGETGSSSFTPINPANYQFFSFASMVVPTNDTFWANDDAMAYRIFDDSGNFLGTNGVFEIVVDASDIYDAGTEVNNPDTDGGAAFAVGRVGADGADQNETITQLANPATDLNLFAGLETNAGTTINNTDVSGNFARIRIVAVPEPSSLGLISLGIGGLFLRRRRSE